MQDSAGPNACNFISETSREAVSRRPAKIFLKVRRYQDNSKQWEKNQRRKHA